MIEFTTSKVRELKGAPLACLVLLALSNTPVSKDWLTYSSGYTDKPIHAALEYLKDQGYVNKSRSGWFLATGFQLPLTRNNSDSDVITIIKDTKEIKPIKLNNNNNNNNNRRKKSESLLIESRNNSDSIWKLLYGAGIFHNNRTEIMLKLPHITEEYLKAKINEYKKAGVGGSKWAGLLINAIEKNEPAPDTSPGYNGHESDCDCKRCKTARAFDIDGRHLKKGEYYFLDDKNNEEESE